jgi:hypothetical protein
MNPKPNTLVALIITAGAIGIGLGVFQLYRGLKLPNAVSDSAATINNTRNELIALQERDTDQDSISDFDELYSYSTSPYLPDTDSDGVPDQDEIAAGTDPNCPAGKTCRDQSVNDNTNAGNTNALTNLFDINANANAADNTNGVVPENTIVNPTLDQVSNEELRDVLKKSGVPTETVDNMDDATLRELYAQALAEENASLNVNGAAANGNTNAANVNGGVTTNTNSTTGSVTAEDLQNLSAAEIRQLLIDSGIPADTVSQYDDTTLKSIFVEALSSSNAD